MKRKFIQLIENTPSFTALSKAVYGYYFDFDITLAP